MDNQRNLILAIVLSALVLFGWQAMSDRFFPVAKPPVTKIEGGQEKVVPQPGADPAADGPRAVRARATVLAETPRIVIDTPKLAGTINLKGARIDDLVFKAYGETVAKDSPPIRLLSPAGSPAAYYAGFGWTGDGVDAPGPNTVWTANGTRLTPQTPVTLSWANTRGQRFETVIAVDSDYMFTITQKLANTGAGAVAARPYGLISKDGVSKDPSSWTLHTGPIGVFNDKANYDLSFEKLDEAGRAGIRFASTGGWIGFGDKYWLTALIPDPKAPVDAGFLSTAPKVYQAVDSGRPLIIAPGKAGSVTQRFFAGAKEVNLLDRYEADLKVAQFGRAIDWGWFEVIEKPIFWVLDQVFKLVGNFGVAIIILTFIVRGLMFPIAQKQFRSMAGMRRVQPKMKELQERHKDDKPRLQQELLKLYQEEKVNPLAGCLPILVQIPVFYALYKVLMVTIEMRHQPFVLWIRDLSAPDPLHILNLFGLLDFTPPSFLGIGVLAILLGISMWLQFKLNPQPMDDAQKQIFALMPWIMMFIMAPFAAGLLIYWITSNFLTIAQQAWLYRQYPIPETPASAAVVEAKAAKKK
ncbi:membrane protein insertase YidC [Rhizorhabdus dicambivorans]|uniref:Membrane protein insertase YidC n=1 Tax=Rhizorhabdus dicambivorans TaxID=1850238 RepID=A0A2A4FN79_9SPHN|nr:membrane protein insertase YidC [Rhizorhabdus dicambivorans]ATE64022.1 membrane protein insertase YidC [Rhizorhabdus dicambivorans]PCE40215.1 membrane protein insertase YidC [Rhizorhabdus dicambivorans]